MLKMTISLNRGARNIWWLIKNLIYIYIYKVKAKFCSVRIDDWFRSGLTDMTSITDGSAVSVEISALVLSSLLVLKAYTDKEAFPSATF